LARKRSAREASGEATAIHLRSVELKLGAAALPDRFPFSIRAVRALARLPFDTPVTFFVGENGSGKSTLLEGIASAIGLATVGSTAVNSDATLGDQRELGRALRLTWNTRVTRGFFLRAEDFFGFTKAIEQMKSDLQRRAAEIDAEYAERSELARTLALGPLRSSRPATATGSTRSRTEKVSSSFFRAASFPVASISSTNRKRPCRRRASWHSSP
jgi:energy-coupling factor transporter ATP-binding protein EcfA2